MSFWVTAKAKMGAGSTLVTWSSDVRFLLQKLHNKQLLSSQMPNGIDIWNAQSV